MLKPWSGSAALRSSVKYPSGYDETASVNLGRFKSTQRVVIGVEDAYLNTMLKTVEL